jgi:hypothetical protein
MKKFYFVALSYFLSLFASAQKDTSAVSYIRKPALGISFLLNDYATAQRIRTTSLSSVFANKQTAKFAEMKPGIGLTYFQGLTEHIDFAGTLASSFVAYDVNGRGNTSEERFLLEVDASANFKLLSEKYVVTPYASLGVGFNKYGVYYGAFIPTGLGLKINMFDEAHIFLNSTYRIPVVANTSAYHFMHMIGVAGIIGGKN